MVAVTTMALGIGATTATFSVVEALLLPTASPTRRQNAWYGRGASVPAASNGLPSILRNSSIIGPRRAPSPSSATMATFSQTSTLTGVGDPTALQIGLVSGNYLDALGVRPLVGRTLRIDDEQAGRTDVVVLSHAVWRTLFSGAESIVGSSIRLDDRSVTVVGVMPADFLPPQSADGWMPLPFHQSAANRRSHFMRPIGRLNAGVTIEHAQAELHAIAKGLALAYPATSAGWSLRLVPLEDQLTGGLNQPSWLLFGAAAFLLLCAAHAAGLLPARATSRAKEVAVRAALGAGRRRLSASC